MICKLVSNYIVVDLRPLLMMISKLIKLEDGTLVEIEVPGDQMVPISGGAAGKVDGAVKNIKPILLNALRPLVETWNEIKNINIEQAEIELGLSFEGEGNLYITKAKAGANLTVKLTIKPNK